MNERIKELYRQAHGTRHYDGDPALDGNPPTVYWQGEASAERFAKLIVQECIDIISPYTVRMNRPGEEYLHPIQEIKKHFGVNK
jgi:hypothetical protein